MRPGRRPRHVPVAARLEPLPGEERPDAQDQTRHCRGGEESERKLSGGKKEVVFKETIAMSTYLVAFIVGEFDALPGLSQEAQTANHHAIEEGAPGHGCGHNLLGTGALAFLPSTIIPPSYRKQNPAASPILFFAQNREVAEQRQIPR